MRIQGKEGQKSGTNGGVRLQQPLVTKGGSVKGVCVTMALGRWPTFRCQPGKLMHKRSH